MAALVLYDDTLTIKDEIRYFGGKKWTGATVLFWLNKWLVIIYYTFSLATGFEISDAMRGPREVVIDIGCIDVHHMGT
ncbi:hypothetical protein GSI_12580 [Ganoderma sinense ZZ0214-1]|uniref:DUF6533 domain-containing protein n=1 Tax=Ganoderma sinense ZZ0214-1 TaxID=1077348 RepID=A0A2G8RT82_9APHY|nr:hypothetical protein GSI_12580 [Ganoderma sinense ZZ0214-1]